MRIEKNEYSLFKELESITTSKEKKDLITTLENFSNTLVERYELKRVGFELPSEKIINFLIDLGLIESNDNFYLLKDILGKKYKEFMSIIFNFLSLDLDKNQLDTNILKYMDFYRKQELEKALNSNSPTFIDLFCGAGGMSLGLSQNGFRPIIANDIEEVCINTYSFNHLDIPKSKAIAGDIKIVSQNIEKYIDEKVDIVIGGPPCQSFSTANRQRVIDDPRNILYKYYVDIVEKTKPKFFIMENVKGMLSVAEQVIDDFHSLKDVDYDVAYKVFNSKDFSVPQNRERLIYIGVRKDLEKRAQDIIDEISENTKDYVPYTLEDGISDLRSLEPFRIKNATELDTIESGKKIEKNKNINMNEYVKTINLESLNSLTFNHKNRFNNDRDIEIFSRMLPGDKSDSPRIADIMPYQSRAHIFKDKYYKLKMNKICKAITAHMKFDCNMYIHPNQARGLTPREAARVQSYPDSYFFLGPYTKTYMQIGNSVPPLMSRYIAQVIKKYLK